MDGVRLKLVGWQTYKLHHTCTYTPAPSNCLTTSESCASGSGNKPPPQQCRSTTLRSEGATEVATSSSLPTRPQPKRQFLQQGQLPYTTPGSNLPASHRSCQAQVRIPRQKYHGPGKEAHTLSRHTFADAQKQV